MHKSVQSFIVSIIIIIVKEAGATTRRDYPFQGSWKAYPWYLSHFLALLPFSIKRGIF